MAKFIPTIIDVVSEYLIRSKKIYFFMARRAIPIIAFHGV